MSVTPLPTSPVLKIVTIDSPEANVLRTKTIDIAENELPKAQEIAKQLFSSLEPHFPAAGLAAPQIGIGRSIFIFSHDRDPKNLEVAINPTFTPLGDEKVDGWEGCFSTILCQGTPTVAKIARYEKIKATYLNEKGEKVEKILSQFGARVFQHECDHLQGIVNVERADATCKSFKNAREMQEFMAAVKLADSKNYKKQ